VIVEQESRLRNAVDSHWLISIGVGSVIYLFASLIPGTTGKAVLYGWLFGFWTALPIVCSMLTVAAVVVFLSVRYLFRDWVQRQLPRLIGRLNRSMRQSGQATSLLTLRLLHAPYSLMNYAAGATDLPTRTFAWTTFVGMLPSNVVFVLAGSQLPTLGRLEDVSPSSLLNLPLLMSLSLIVIMPIAINSIRRRRM
jgi:uncharacterized membrane protein YdjX (TVP38/TMEM64 family)